MSPTPPPSTDPENRPDSEGDEATSLLDDAGRRRPGLPSRVKTALGIIVLALVGWLVWQWANDMSGVKRDAPKVTAIIPLPPPPPPPPEPPPEEKVVEEEKIVQPEPEPTPVEEVKPQDEAPPSPADDLADPMQIDGDAQAGSDSFNIGAGKGGGMAGSGTGRLGNGTYSQYLSYAFQRILRDNEATRNLAYRLHANVWLTAGGQITRVELTQSSGDREVDDKVIAAIRSVPRLDERPPASLSLPVRVVFQGRRPS